MRIIPVMDLMDGKVVHATAGRREEYEPVESQIADSPDPLSVASAFQKLGLEELYIADLNAIRSNGDNLNSIDRLTSCTHMEVMVDGGFRSAADVDPYVLKGISKPVLATETLESYEEIDKTRNNFGIPLVASIDMKERKVVARTPRMSLSFPELVQKFSEKRVAEILLLSLNRVGTSTGPAEKILAEALELTTVPLLVGGGISTVEDILRLEEVGASGVLLATALHEETVGEEDIASF